MKTRFRNKELSSSINKLKEESSSFLKQANDLINDEGCMTTEILHLEERINLISSRINANLPQSNTSPKIIHNQQENETSHLSSALYTDSDSLDTLSKLDIVVSCISGGLGVLIDFLIVKIPKTSNISINGELQLKEGSPLNSYMRTIGFEKDKKTSKWVEVLEKWFNVNYDKSIIPGEKGFCPNTHRLYNLGHDPSPSGFLWAMKDAICGTMSYIDKNGYLKIIKSKSISPSKLLAMPIIWIGHIISDVFTKAGVPFPGSCFLRTLQIGSIGEKGRTIAQIVDYMYAEGYDIRHLLTMTTVNGVIELIVRLYYILTREKVEVFARPTAYIQSDREMIKMRLDKMRLYAYAVATTGNIAKLASYGWNPLALNAPVWIEFLRLALKELNKKNSCNGLILDSIRQRSDIEQNFKDIYIKLGI